MNDIEFKRRRHGLGPLAFRIWDRVVPKASISGMVSGHISTLEFDSQGRLTGVQVQSDGGGVFRFSAHELEHENFTISEEPG